MIRGRISFPKSCERLGILGVRQQNRESFRCVLENVDAHRRIAMALVMWRFPWAPQASLGTPQCANPCPPQSRQIASPPACVGDLNRRYRHVPRREIDMLLQHAAVIHFVDVIARQDEHVLRALAADRNKYFDKPRPAVALIPLLRKRAILRRQHLNIVAKAGQRRPAPARMCRFKLSALILPSRTKNAPQI